MNDSEYRLALRDHNQWKPYFENSPVDLGLDYDPDFFQHLPIVIRSKKPLSYWESIYNQPPPDLGGMRDYDPRPQPFLVIRSTGIPYAEIIIDSLKNYGVLEQKAEISQFREVARYIYPVKPEKPLTWQWLALNEVLGTYGYCDPDQALLLTFETLEFQGQKGISALPGLKKFLRSQIGITLYLLEHEGGTIGVDLHHVHAPDPDPRTVKLELNILQNAINKTGPFSEV